jgi:hypothetical protein
VTLPAEEMTLAGFAQGGRADTMAPGPLQELRVRAYLDLLQERDSRALADPGDEAPAATDTAYSPDSDSDDPRDGHNGNGGPGGPQDGPGGTGAQGRTSAARQDGAPSLAALVNITVPLAALLGADAAPGEAAAFGLLDAADARALIPAAGRTPDTRWCVTALHPTAPPPPTAARPGLTPGRQAR